MVKSSYRFFSGNTSKCMFYDTFDSLTEMNTLVFNDDATRTINFDSADNTKRCIVYTPHEGNVCTVTVRDYYTGLAGSYDAGDTTFNEAIFDDFIDGSRFYGVTDTGIKIGTVSAGVVTFPGVDLSGADSIYTMQTVTGTKVFLSMPLRGNEITVVQSSGEREIFVKVVNEEE